MQSEREEDMNQNKNRLIQIVDWKEEIKNKQVIYIEPNQFKQKGRNFNQRNYGVTIDYRFINTILENDFLESQHLQFYMNVFKEVYKKKIAAAFCHFFSEFYTQSTEQIYLNFNNFNKKDDEKIQNEYQHQQLKQQSQKPIQLAQPDEIKKKIEDQPEIKIVQIKEDKNQMQQQLKTDQNEDRQQNDSENIEAAKEIEKTNIMNNEDINQISQQQNIEQHEVQQKNDSKIIEAEKQIEKTNTMNNEDKNQNPVINEDTNEKKQQQNTEQHENQQKNDSKIIEAEKQIEKTNTINNEDKNQNPVIDEDTNEKKQQQNTEQHEDQQKNDSKIIEAEKQIEKTNTMNNEDQNQNPVINEDTNEKKQQQNTEQHGDQKKDESNSLASTQLQLQFDQKKQNTEHINPQQNSQKQTQTQQNPQQETQIQQNTQQKKQFTFVVTNMFIDKPKKEKFQINKLPDLLKQFAEMNNLTSIQDLKTQDFLYFPINLSQAHWISAVINLIDKKIYYFDSYYESVDSDVKEGIFKILESLDFDRNSFQFEPKWNKQLNGYDCGIFILLSLLFTYQGDLKYPYNQSRATQFRSRILYDLAIVGSQMQLTQELFQSIIK